jgi:8-oxo-dGTP diphosphatase
MEKIVKTVVAAIIQKEGKIFAAMRSEVGFMLNKWVFPGGKLEKGETDEQAIVRELKEELAIDIFDLVYFDHVEYEYEKFVLHMNAYLCKTNDEINHLHVHKKAGFFDKNQLADLDFLPADAPLISKLLADWR